MRPFIARLGVVAIAAAALAACSGNQGAVPVTAGIPQGASGAVLHGGVLHVAPADVAAAYKAHDFSYRIFPTSNHRTPSGVRADKTKVFFPADLHFYGGPVMKTAVEHNIYVNCKTLDQACWGAPEAFQTNLTGSLFAGLLTQYTKAKSTAYTLGEGTPVQYQAFSNIYYDNDLFSILHAVAQSIGKSGYGDEYHIFLPKGTDTCFDATTVCYSPDIPADWFFCAYHGQVTFSDLGPIVFSVEPYQNVNIRGVGGCTYSNLPKGMNPLVQSTDSTLAHETFESITDPNPNLFSTLGWYNIAYNQEIGDLCDAFPITMKVGKAQYFLQTMYSNHYHGCADGP